MTLISQINNGLFCVALNNIVSDKKSTAKVLFPKGTIFKAVNLFPLELELYFSNIKNTNTILPEKKHDKLTSEIIQCNIHNLSDLGSLPMAELFQLSKDLKIDENPLTAEFSVENKSITFSKSFLNFCELLDLKKFSLHLCKGSLVITLGPKEWDSIEITETLLLNKGIVKLILDYCMVNGSSKLIFNLSARVQENNLRGYVSFILKVDFDNFYLRTRNEIKTSKKDTKTNKTWFKEWMINNIGLYPAIIDDLNLAEVFQQATVRRSTVISESQSIDSEDLF